MPSLFFFIIRQKCCWPSDASMIITFNVCDDYSANRLVNDTKTTLSIYLIIN